MPQVGLELPTLRSRLECSAPRASRAPPVSGILTAVVSNLGALCGSVLSEETGTPRPECLAEGLTLGEAGGVSASVSPSEKRYSH